MISLEAIDDIVTEAVIEEYWERGYWVAPKLLDDDEIERLRAAHDRLWAGDDDYEVPSIYGKVLGDPASPALRQQVDAFWRNAEMRRAILSPVMGKIAATLMRVNYVRLWHDQALYKPAQAGAESLSNLGNVGWHQDYGFWHSCDTTNFCSSWVALQDTDLRNGTMKMIVGSHKWGVIDGSNNDKKDMETWADHFARLGGGEWVETPVLLKAGEVSFHHGLTFHGSGPNTTTTPRLCVISHMMPGDTRYRAGHSLHPNVALLGPNYVDGQTFENDFFPQMWPVPEPTVRDR
ncbi:MAG: phytanoyl-CoA dioxygenase family protein [Anaerolineales bacterium]|nr:phytanoyl-CoA dioxygenase family protein [Anaerolineales bacterium]